MASWGKNIIRLVGVPFFTFLLFVFQSTDPIYYKYELLWSFFMALFLWEGNRLIGNGLNKYFSWRGNVSARIVVQITLSLIFTLWLTFVSDKLLYAFIYEGQFSFLAFKSDLFFFSIISILYTAINSGEHFFKQWRQSLVQTEELKRENLIAQYETLKSQVNPHFLFNSINTLIGLIQEDKQLAVEYGHHFAQVYRYILEKSKKELVLLKEELEIIETHAILLKARFGEHLALKVDVPDQKGYIPPLTLQMLLENAIKHNVISKKHPLIIDIRQKDRTLLISNNVLRKNQTENSTGIGLKNIQNRYQYLSKEHMVKIKETKNQFIVELPLLDQENP